MKKRVDNQTATDLALRTGVHDGAPMMLLELMDELGDVIATFHMNLQTAESVCVTLALWYNQHAPGQTAPTTTRIQ